MFLARALVARARARTIAVDRSAWCERAWKKMAAAAVQLANGARSSQCRAEPGFGDGDDLTVGRRRR